MNPRQRLADERALTSERLDRVAADHAGFVAASKDSNADDEHDPEGATIAFERSQVATLVRSHQQHLADLDAALARLDAGTYGTCEGCGSPIPQERLDARPTARHCVDCAA